MLWKNRIISIDIETTGLDAAEDEIVQISIVNGRGKTLYNSYIRPEDGHAWDRGMNSRKAAWQAVRNAPTLRHERRRIERILRRADLIVGYNHKAFDMPFLAAKGINTAVKARLYDVMLEFAYIAGEYNDEYGSYRWNAPAQADVCVCSCTGRCVSVHLHLQVCECVPAGNLN